MRHATELIFFIIYSNHDARATSTLEMTYQTSVTSKLKSVIRRAEFLLSVQEIMADEGKKDMSIVEHDILEVYEVEDGALQECMMFVKKLSETSLRDMETERNNLNDLLVEAEKEVSKLKTSLKTANSNVEELASSLKAERGQRLKVEDLLQTVQTTADELKTELQQSKDSAAALQKIDQEKICALTEAKEVIAKISDEKVALQEELTNLQHLRSQDEKETNSIHLRLLKEQEKILMIEEQHEEEVIKLNQELTELQKSFSSLKEQTAAEVTQLKQKLDLEQKMNESLSNEADSCVDDIKKQLIKVTRENEEMQASKKSISDRLNTAEEEMLTLRRKLNEEKHKREELYQHDKARMEEASSQLEKKISENEVLNAEKEDIEKKLHSLEVENKELICRATELEESLEVARGEVFSIQEEFEALKTSQKLRAEHTEETADSWANRVEEAEDWEHKYRELEIEQEALYKQFTQVRKHRNRVLRENGGLRRQMSMAAAQLAVTNQKFQRQLHHFRTQLNMAEHLYREKMLECSILEVQLKHLLKSSPSSQQTYDYTNNNSEDQARDYIARSVDFGRRHDFSASRPVQRSRDDNTRHVQHAARHAHQHPSRHVTHQKRVLPTQAAIQQVEAHADDCTTTVEEECNYPGSCTAEHVIVPVNCNDTEAPDPNDVAA